MADDIYNVKVGDKLTPAQIRQAAGVAEPNTAPEETVIASETLPDTENEQATDPSREAIEANRKYKYPLTLSANYPARIIFKAIKVDGVDLADKIGSGFSSLLKGIGNAALNATPLGLTVGTFGRGAEAVKTLAQGRNNESTTAAVADASTDNETKQDIAQAEKEVEQSLMSYENSGGGISVGQVTLPLPRDIRFSDNAQYETANLGTIGGAVEGALEGQNPFAGATQTGQFMSTASAIAAQAIAKGVGEATGAAIGAAVGRGPGAILGTSVAGNTFDGMSPAVRSATRIATAPNQRTLFSQVNIRNFAFAFKMIANNEQEAREIKNIVKFFRQELYPEKIPLGESGVPLGYKFPNMFEIDIKNRFGENPAFKIQRCYLRDIQTSFNATAGGMHTDGQFIEVDISLSFQEIVALDKAKVRDGY